MECGSPYGPGGCAICHLVGLIAASVADEDEHSFGLVGPEHDARGAQERLWDHHQAWGQLDHLVKEEEGAGAGSEVPLDPELKILLVALHVARMGEVGDGKG